MFPPLHRDGHVYLDTGFVQDANLSEMVRHGAEQIWVLWGLGNTGVYRGDALHLYVQMLEMSANAALNLQLAAIRELNGRIARGDSPYGQTRAIEVHVVRPDHPLPLDPELFSGRIDHATLIDMGHADGWQYLSAAGMAGDGSPRRLPPPGDNPSRMADPVPGVRLQFEFAGELTLASDGSLQAARLNLCVHVPAIEPFIAAAEPHAPLSGRLRLAALSAAGAAAEPQPVSGGRYRQITLADGTRTIEYRMQLRHAGQLLGLVATQTLRDDPGFDLWQDLSTLSLRIVDGETDWAGGDLRLSLPDLKSWLATVQATETRSLVEATATVGRYVRFLLRNLRAVYGWNG